MAEILVIGLSARALAQAAHRAGYEPLAADFFGDLDLHESSAASERIGGGFAAGFAEAPMLEALTRLAAGWRPVGAVWSTGFEDRPQLLDRIAEHWPLLGNPARVVAEVKQPQTLAAACRRLGIRHPSISMTQPDGLGWLAKQTGGAGGSHIRADGQAAMPAADGEVYWQKQVPGRAVSALVLAADGAAHILGFSEQWSDPAPDAPFRYGGALRPAALSEATGAELQEAAIAIVEDFRLVGLNSVDFVVAADEWHLIEVNPRPGATIDIFDTPGDPLFALHVEACRGHLPCRRPPLPGAAAAQTVYARRPIDRVPAFRWPDWTADRQPPGTSVAAGGPLCTVMASAQTPAETRRLVESRGRSILAELGAG